MAPCLLQNDYNMGEIGFDPLGLCPTDPKEKYDMQTKELNNGRCVSSDDPLLCLLAPQQNMIS